MCGICGQFSVNFREDAAQSIRAVHAMTLLMTRRGPDDEGYWQDEYCAFGFRRLSILDLTSMGHQPMTSHNERYVLVFNGEVYNFREIRHELELRGAYFRSSGDAEVVLYALAEWGVNALERFNGMFALAFYDSKKRTLLLARDHAGIKPLYYLKTAQGLVFASQYNQVIQHPWARGLDVCRESLSLYLRLGWIPAPYAMLEHTHLLDAGCWLSIEATTGDVQQGRFYEFPKYLPATLHGEQAVEALDEVLQRAVRRHLISDVPVGLFLSGGIDSPLVAALAHEVSGQSLQAFSIGVQDPEMDESQDAVLYARELVLDHTLQMIDEELALGMLDDVARANTEPSADFSIFPTLLVSRLASQQVKVVLTGDGGDEPFWGYPGRFVSMLEQAPYFRQVLPLRLVHIALRKVLQVGKATREVLYPDLGRLFQKKHTIFAEKDLKALFPGILPVPDELDLFQYTGTDLDKTAQWVRWNEFRLHLARILMKADRASMYYSLETRVPLLDKEVLNVAVQTDWHSCLDLENRWGKIPLRKVLGRYIHHQTQAKKGFTVPMYRWLQGPLQELLRAKVLERRDLLGQPVDRVYLARMNQQLLHGDRSKAWGLWLLLSLVLWEETHLKQA